MSHGENPIHLGDGAYATFDGYGILLTANHHDPKQATDSVYLELSVWRVLKAWVGRMGEESNESR